jgi:hypothetical protein
MTPIHAGQLSPLMITESNISTLKKTCVGKLIDSLVIECIVDCMLVPGMHLIFIFRTVVPGFGSVVLLSPGKLISGRQSDDGVTT